MSEKKNTNQLIYVEPNLENSFKDYDEHGLGQQYAIAPNLEDFCISVDLEVEVRGREVIGSGTTGTKTMVMSWNNTKDGSKVSFMQGTTINFNANKGSSGGYVDSLTTSYTDIFYNDIKDKGTNEMFGISSIDIDYNNYFVPQITIQFVDIRGVSLFAPEQLAHNSSNNGMSGIATSDVAGSFFKCFFTFPYPKFRLSVKGIYGQPVAYELTCSDFRATFDSSTGNFGAKATFIGYAFSLLNDVTLNVLAVAPLSDYLGRDYWNSKLNSTFMVDDSNFNKVPMKTLTEIINAIKNAKDDVGKLSNENPACINQIKLSSQLEAINKIELTYTNFINSMITNAQKREPFITAETSKLHKTFLLSDNKGLLVLSNDSKDMIDTYVDGSLYEPLLTAIAEYNNANGDVLKQNIPSKPEGNVYKILVTDGKAGVRLLTTSIDKNNPQAKILTNALNSDKVFSDDINGVLYENNNMINKPLNNYQLGFIYTDNGLINKITDIKNKTANEVTKNEQEIASFQNKTFANSIGFIPNVENITKILMAHLETLMYMLYTTANRVGVRSLSSMGIGAKNTDINAKATNVPPFPKVTDVSGDKGNKKIVDSWIGKRSGNIPERDLIHGLLNGVQELQDSIDKAISEVKQTDEGGNIIATPMLIPLTPLDMIIGGNPYGNKIDFSNISDFIGRVVIRMHQVLGLTSFNEKDWVNNASLLGKADARNFCTFFSHPSDEFIRRINMQDFTAEFMLDIAGNSSKDTIQKEKKENKWAWEGDDNTSHALSISSNSSKSVRFLNIYKVRDVANIINKVIPVQTLTFKEIINDMKVKENLTGTIMPNSLNHYITMSDKLSSTKKIDINPNIFKVDEDYTKYGEFVKQIVLDSDTMSGITNNFKCIYESDEYKKYYDNSFFLGDKENSFFGKKYENATFNSAKGNRIFLSSKRDINTIKSTDDIFSDNLYSANDRNDFSYIYQKDGDSTKKIKRDLGYGDLFNDLSQISNYIIPSFNGLGEANRESYNCHLSNETSLFGQYGYYLQNQVTNNSQLVKALLFLSTLEINYGHYIDKLISSDEGIFLAPKACALYCGAYLWRYNEMSTYKDEKQDVILKDKFFNFSSSKEKTIFGTEIEEKLFKIRDDIKNYLIKEFKTWSTTYFSNKIQSAFELRKGGKVYSAEEIKTLAIKMQSKPNTIFDSKTWKNGTDFKEDGYVNLEHYLRENFDDNFFVNYMSISHAHNSELSYSVKLFNRESSTSVNEITQFLLTLATTIKGIKYIFNNQMNYSLDVDNGYATQYMTSFLNELRVQYKSKSIEVENNNGFSLANDPNANENIKIALYQYCKLIYDRWVGGTHFEDWSLENFYESHFYFIDAYYNKIGNIALINLDDIRDRMINSLTQSEYSLLSFMGDILAKNSFQLMCVQNFSDLSDSAQMKEMFKSIAYNDMKKPSIHPDFVVMYTYEPSHNLNIEDSEYDDDALVINSDDNEYWPEIIKGKDMASGYTIPAFGVSYGSQYQSYFSNINVSMESPIVTEQSIKAQYMIAGQNNPNNGENGKGSVFIGQDLFTIYSNNSYTCTITMVGCAWVQPLMYFCLLNIPMFRGAYLIQKVTHHIEPGNMVTTITGVRMCKTATPIMNKWILDKLNNESGSANVNQQSKLIDMKNKIASIDNDCEYKVFPTITIGEGGPVFDLNQLKANTNLAWLERQSLKRDYKNLYEAIIATVGAEVGDGQREGELGVKLVVVVMINRLMGSKGNWEEVLRKGQTAVGVRSYNETKGFTSTVRWVEEVLTKGPACIVGMTTEIPKLNETTGMGPVLIKSLGINTGQMSTPVKIDMNMAQKIAGYCTTNGYYRRVGKVEALERFIDNDPKQGLYWWNSEYFFHHKGHVFTGMSSKAEKAHWTYVPKVSNTDKNKLSDTAQGLFNAIQQTVNSTENIKIDLIGKIGRNNNEILITTNDASNKKGKLASVFDVILNAYYNNFTNLFWVVKDRNDTILNNPHSILVTAKDDKISKATNRSVAMVINDKDYTTVGSFGAFNDKTDFSDSNTFSPLFYRSLYKRYAPLGTKEAIAIFGSEVKNFTTNNISNVNNLLNENQPSPCPATISGNGNRIRTDETQYTTIAPALDAHGINETLYKKCLDTSVAKFKELAKTKWDDNFTLIGVRSSLNQNGQPITNKYIDICVIIHNGGKKYLAPFTTVPGLTYLMNTNGLANSKGVSILKKGSYNVYKIDFHKKEYKALTQRSGNVTTFRDNNFNDEYNFFNPSSGIFGINLHNNGSVDGVNVNDDSAGCQVFKRMKDFYFMMGLAVKSGKDIFNYTLIDEADLG